MNLDVTAAAVTCTATCVASGTQHYGATHQKRLLDIHSHQPAVRHTALLVLLSAAMAWIHQNPV